MKKVIVTGGAGFIGSAFVWELNQRGIDDILIVDDLLVDEKKRNLAGLRYSDYSHKDGFLQSVAAGRLKYLPDAIVHMGACSSTTETNAGYLMENNYRSTRILAEWAVFRGIRFVYASSAATYGDGKRGFSDKGDLRDLRPLNMYGYYKHLFDLYAERTGLLGSIVGLKFFNVFGPNEYHKGDMASVAFKAFKQVMETGRLRLYKSYRHGVAHGEQMRDFVYIKDCIRVMWWILTHREVTGLFNLGTGRPRSWNDLARALFAAMERPLQIEYIDMPEPLRGGYQYFTQADVDRLRETGCPLDFGSLEESVHDYVANYLQTENPYLSSPLVKQ
jgi:ADP-L-glycero-D-manno-heptose 6-epimerase